MATRREFIRDCSVGALSAALLPVGLTAAPGKWRVVSLSDVPFAVLAAQVRSWFLLRESGGGVQAVELISVETSGNRDRPADDGGTESFSLLFRGETTRPVGQDTYSFEHPRLGRFDMFIVPIGCEDRTRCYYEAVFNRPPPEAPARGRRPGIRLVH